MPEVLSIRAIVGRGSVTPTSLAFLWVVACSRHLTRFFSRQAKSLKDQSTITSSGRDKWGLAKTRFAPVSGRWKVAVGYKSMAIPLHRSTFSLNVIVRAAGTIEERNRLWATD